MKMPRLHVSTGCPEGIGPEVTLAALKSAPKAQITVHLTSPNMAGAFSKTGAHVVEHTFDDPLRAQASALNALKDAALQDLADAVITGPIQKSCLAHVDGGPFPGQTEFFHHHLQSDDGPSLMCFAGGPFALGLLTVHLPLKDVAQSITPELLRARILRLHSFAQKLSGKTKPILKVLALNPHAGEGGLLGREEIEIYQPVLAALQSEGFNVSGPVPADGFFGHRRNFESVDAVLASAHDQGLAPYKLLSEGRGVNVTWGLRTVRTSPDHGTANDIAGRGIADSSSMRHALELAAKLAD